MILVITAKHKFEEQLSVAASVKCLLLLLLFQIILVL